MATQEKHDGKRICQIRRLMGSVAAGLASLLFPRKIIWLELGIAIRSVNMPPFNQASVAMVK